MVINKNLLLGNQEANRTRPGIRLRDLSQNTVASGQVSPSEGAGAAENTRGTFRLRRNPRFEGHGSIAEHMREMKNALRDFRAERQRHMEQMESAREAARAQAEAFRKMQIAMEIAARITRGDNVPQSDKDFLLEYSPKMFKLAMATRNHNNEDPKDYDALATDENKSVEVNLSVQKATISAGMQSASTY